jgi:hypothetical protein
VVMGVPAGGTATGSGLLAVYVPESSVYRSRRRRRHYLWEERDKRCIQQQAGLEG